MKIWKFAVKHLPSLLLFVMLILAIEALKHERDTANIHTKALLLFEKIRNGSYCSEGTK